MSRIGLKPILLQNVEVKCLNPIRKTFATKHYLDRRPYFKVEATGPIGTCSVLLPPCIKLDISDKIIVSVEQPEFKRQMSHWGTSRQVLNNLIVGVSEGWKIPIKLVGVGYKCSINNNVLFLKVGYCNTLEVPVPKGITATCPESDSILLFGMDKQQVTQFAATIRKHRKPEPYKLKGIFVNNEKIDQKKITKK